MNTVKPKRLYTGTSYSKAENQKQRWSLEDSQIKQNILPIVKGKNYSRLLMKTLQARRLRR